MAGGSTPAGRAGAATEIDVEGRRLRLTNLDKVLYPQTGFTKAGVVDYYARIAPVMLAHLSRRPVTLVRYPNGVEGSSFFEKRCPPHRPDWVTIGRVDGREPVDHCVLDDLASLIWVANLAALELHTPQATVDDPDHPTAIVFDLDPGAPADILDCCRVALEVREMLAAAGLTAVVKTSGSKGLHLAAPVRDASAEDTKVVSRAVGEAIEVHAPDRVTVTMARDIRPGKVFVDWSQNDRHKTTVAAYSLRARPHPTVSTPLRWDEVSDALDGRDPAALSFEAPDTLERVERYGDLYAGVLGPGTPLPG